MRLSHPNLVTFHDFGQLPGGAYYIAMELVRGVELARLLLSTAAPLPPPVVGAVMAQALEGVHALHELKGEDGGPLGAVHRDLSPQNLVVGYDGRVRVLDFGVAKARNQRSFTVPGVVKGKPLYMSPEQAKGERLDRRSDLFSMGLVLFELLTGERPFARDTAVLSMEAIVEAPAPRPSYVSAEVWDVLEQVLAKRPQDRHRTAAELAAHLREVLPPFTDAELSRWMHDTHPEPLERFERWDRLAMEHPG